MNFINYKNVTNHSTTYFKREFIRYKNADSHHWKLQQIFTHSLPSLYLANKFNNSSINSEQNSNLYITRIPTKKIHNLQQKPKTQSNSWVTTFQLLSESAQLHPTDASYKFRHRQKAVSAKRSQMKIDLWNNGHSKLSSGRD